MFILMNSWFVGISFAQASQDASTELWIGVGSDWRVINKPSSLLIDDVLDLWRNDIENKINRMGFNTVRLAFAFPESGETTRNVIIFEELNQVLSLLDSYGLKAILDLHNYYDMQGYFG
jgi:aryl-phospho-beta-D-glucosidase BglC (GH1 family)